MNWLFHFGVHPDELDRYHEHELKAVEAALEQIKKEAMST